MKRILLAFLLVISAQAQTVLRVTPSTSGFVNDITNAFESTQFTILSTPHISLSSGALTTNLSLTGTATIPFGSVLQTIYNGNEHMNRAGSTFNSAQYILDNLVTDSGAGRYGILVDGVEKFRVDAGTVQIMSSTANTPAWYVGNANDTLELGKAHSATSDTKGYVYINSVAGVPTGVPATANDNTKMAVVFDRTAGQGKLYTYHDAAWDPLVNTTTFNSTLGTQTGIGLDQAYSIEASRGSAIRGLWENSNTNSILSINQRLSFTTNGFTVFMAFKPDRTYYTATNILMICQTDNDPAHHEGQLWCYLSNLVVHVEAYHTNGLGGVTTNKAPLMTISKTSGLNQANDLPIFLALAVSNNAVSISIDNNYSESHLWTETNAFTSTGSLSTSTNFPIVGKYNDGNTNTMILYHYAIVNHNSYFFPDFADNLSIATYYAKEGTRPEWQWHDLNESTIGVSILFDLANVDPSVVNQTWSVSPFGYSLQFTNQYNSAINSGVRQLVPSGEIDAQFGNFKTNLTTATFTATSIQVFANNAAAIAGGLSVGAVYRTGADPDVLCIVH